jgi:flagellar basal-body rod modification protein FlgD
MNINPLSGNTTTTGTGSAVQDAQGMFLQLLMAQLKSQSPLDPVDPNQFVGQLVQFNTLDQIMQIRQLVESAVQGTAGETSTTQTEGA